MATVRDLKVEQLKALKAAKDQYGAAKTAEEKSAASAIGDTIRSEGGITGVGSSGVYTAAEISSLIKEKEDANRLTSISDEYAARRNQAISGLRTRAEGDKASIQAGIDTIEPGAMKSKTAADVRGMQTAKRLSEIMSKRGYGSGDTRQELGSAAASTQQSITDIDVQKNADLAAGQRQLSDVDRALSGDISAAEAGLTADELGALRQQRESNRSFGLQEASLTGTYGGVPTLGGRSALVQEEANARNAETSRIANEAAVIQNDINSLKLEALPDQLKNEAQMISQQLESGAIDIQQAQVRLNNLKKAAAKPDASNITPEEQNLVYKFIDEQLSQFDNIADAYDYVVNLPEDQKAELGENGYNALLSAAEGTTVQEPEKVQDTTPYTSYIDNMLVTGAIPGKYGLPGTPGKIDEEGVRSYARGLYLNGTINKATADQLLAQYGL